jgi:hypothetical protein
MILRVVGEEEPIIYLKLEETEEGAIALRCCYEDGDPWEQGTILLVKPSGCVKICMSFSVPGWQVDHHDQVLVEYEAERSNS